MKKKTPMLTGEEMLAVLGVLQESRPCLDRLMDAFNSVGKALTAESAARRLELERTCRAFSIWRSGELADLKADDALSRDVVSAARLPAMSRLATLRNSLTRLAGDLAANRAVQLTLTQRGKDKSAEGQAAGVLLGRKRERERVMVEQAAEIVHKYLTTVRKVVNGLADEFRRFSATLGSNDLKAVAKSVDTDITATVRAIGTMKGDLHV